jgi:hypothetical protein
MGPLWSGGSLTVSWELTALMRAYYVKFRPVGKNLLLDVVTDEMVHHVTGLTWGGRSRLGFFLLDGGSVLYDRRITPSLLIGPILLHDLIWPFQSPIAWLPDFGIADVNVGLLNNVYTFYSGHSNISLSDYGAN